MTWESSKCFTRCIRIVQLVQEKCLVPWSWCSDMHLLHLMSVMVRSCHDAPNFLIKHCWFPTASKFSIILGMCSEGCTWVHQCNILGPILGAILWGDISSRGPVEIPCRHRDTQLTSPRKSHDIPRGNTTMKFRKLIRMFHPTGKSTIRFSKYLNLS